VTTIKDVAEEAEVSIATVSAVINGTTFVSEELKKRVLESIKKLDYHPNLVARGLKTKKIKVIGVLVPDITNPFYPAMVYGAEESAREAGFNIFLSTTMEDPHIERSVLNSLMENRVGGVLAGFVEDENKEVLEQLQKEKIPFVLINRKPRDYYGPFVGGDWRLAGLVVTNHLIKQGYKKIAFMGHSPGKYTSYEREIGFKEAMQSKGLEIKKEYQFYAAYSQKRAYKIFKENISAQPLPEAIFCANDLMAFGVINALLHSGYRVPEDIAVVGCDDIEFSAHFKVPLTTMHMPKYQIGYIGAEMLIDRISGKTDSKDIKSYDVLSKPRLIIRDSCGANLQKI